MIDRIPLDRSGVIEAGAGTGKTYTIERLFLRLIVERRLPVEKILVVTFTEKAAGELRDRIRRCLLERRDEARTAGRSEEAKALDDALRSYAAAAISTIHGFCHRVLNEHSFAALSCAGEELVDGEAVREEALHEVMTKRWVQECGAGLARIMMLCDVDPDWIANLLRLSSGFRLGFDRIHPSANLADAARALAELDARLSRLSNLVPAGSETALIAGYGKLNFDARSRVSRLAKVWQPLIECLGAHRADPEARAAAFAPIADFVNSSDANTAFRENPRRFEGLIPGKWTRQIDNSEVCPGLATIAAAAEDARESLESLRQCFAAGTVLALAENADRILASRGRTTFDEMVARVSRTAASSPRLVEELRRRYTVALIDECQDTDDVQWNIFRRVFLDPPEPGRAVLLIGDPKQAIYGFRGADLQTYFRAKDEVTKRDSPFDLDVSYRQTPELLECLNRCFAESWFIDQRTEYRSLRSPAPEKRRFAVAFDDVKHPPLALHPIALPGAKGASAWRTEIAGTIRRYLDPSSPALVIRVPDEPEPRSPKPSEIAVLVRSGREAELAEESLRLAGIPCVIYKKAGIFSSREATQVLHLLGAVADPHDRSRLGLALMTSFFELPPSRRGEPAECPAATALIERWRSLCAERRFGRAFRSMLTETGVLVREAAAADGERRLSNYRQVFDALETLAEEGARSLEELCDEMLRIRIEESNGPDDAQLYRIEGEVPKVQILTMHAAKGLEFPVVFIAGGITQRSSQEYHWRHDAEGARTLDFSDAGRATGRNEAEEEVRRLFYVAFTRAIFRLHVPLFPQGKQGAGPLQGWLAEILDRVRPSLEGEPWANGYPATGTGRSVAAAETPIPIDLSARALVAPDVFRRCRRLDSFSALKARSEASAVREDAERRRPIEDEVEEETFQASVAALPAGAAAGTMLHELLERIRFDLVVKHASEEAALGDSPLARFVERTLDRYDTEIFGGRRSEGARPERPAACAETLRLVWRALSIPYLPGNRCVGRIDAKERRAEVEFVQGVRDRDRIDLRTGFIDLVFRLDGKWYVLDWKSNRLDAYDAEALDEAMAEEGYRLQAEIYERALAAWLPRLDPTYVHTRDFGGAIYVFLRGLDPQSPQRGVWRSEGSLVR